MSFFKFDPEKVANKIADPINKGKQVELNRSQKAMIEGLNNYRFWVHISARRTGKSYAASIVALAKLLEPKQQVIVVAPNYNLSSIIWDYVISFIKQLGIETERLNQKDKVVILINGSTFRLLSANNRDSLVGRAAHLLIVDEAAVIDSDEYFQRDLRPALSTFEDSRALFITTPRGRANYIHEYFQRGQPNMHNQYPEWGSDLFDWQANPNLREADILEAKRTLADSIFQQEYYCKWTIFEGQVYPATEEIHMADTMKKYSIIPGNPKYEFIAGLDMGYRDSTAFVVIATDHEKYFVIDEFLLKEAPTGIIAERIRELEKKWNIDFIYIDSAAQQTKADLAYEHDIFTINAVKSVNDGINHVRNLVDKGNIIFDEDSGRAAFHAFTSYRWDINSKTEKPVHDEYSHYCDAIRYAIYSHARNSSVGIYSSER